MRRLFKIAIWTVGIFVLLLIGIIAYVRTVAQLDDPVFETQSVDTTYVSDHDGLRKIEKNWFRKSESGLYEMYVEGNAYERGLAIGKLSKELIQYQEEVFNQQIHQLVPSESYLTFLKYIVGWFNRDLDEHVPEEYRQEIYGVSRVASANFDYIAPPYQRILNYHAAHDIGHALQNMALVGCTAFATWGNKSVDSTLIVGRNFDFYVGDDFAKNKIVAFYSPDKGHRFMMITFGGMTGVLSGMNDQGLTVTLNAAKSEIPTGSATPVSLLAREILQYASTIDEAYAIAQKHQTFVAESFLIGSARDNKAAVIEKSPGGIGLFEPKDEILIATNHFQSEELGRTELNEAHMKTSASVYRHHRVAELLDRAGKNSVISTARILRDQKGMNDKDIGLGNEKSINQLIAHHAVIFQPEWKRVWVSTFPWQLGKFVCYDLNVIFSLNKSGNEEIYESSLTIPADSFLLTKEYGNAVKFNRHRFPFQPKTEISPDSLVLWNSNSYLSYMLAGDRYLDADQFDLAADMYAKSLQKEIATVQERKHIESNLEKALSELQRK